MILIWSRPVEHLIDFYDICIRFTSGEVVASTIEAQNQAF
jgi:hypothetical protein